MVRSNPLISVIVPVYNAEKYLPECIESVLKQDYKNIELILVNDGSVDSSGTICERYKETDNRIEVYHQKNGGASTARNRGLRQAKGDFIMFLDSDDYWVKNCLGNIMDKLKEHNYLVDVVFLRHAMTKEDGSLSQFEGYEFAFFNRNELADYILTQKKVDVSACFKIMNRKLFENENLYFKDNLLAEDIDWFFNLLTIAETYTTDSGDFYCYRMTDNSASAITSEKRMVDYLYILNKWIILSEKFEKLGLKQHHIFYMVGYEYEILLAGYYNFSESIREKYKDQLHDIFWILDYRNRRRSKIIKLVYKVMGFNHLCRLLNIYLNRRVIK